MRTDHAMRNVLGGLLLAWLAIAPAPVAAADPPPPVERLLFVPFDDLPAILGGKNERVFMTRQEYETLQQQARQTAPVQAPVDATLAEAAYEASIEDGLATIRGNLAIEVLRPGLHAIPLDMAGVRLRRARLEDEPAPVARDAKGRVVVFLPGARRHQLELELQAIVTIAAAQQSMQFRLPHGAAGSLQLEIPGNVDVKSGPSVVARQYDAAQDRTRFELIPSRAPIDLVMSLNNRLLRTQRVVVARSVFLSELTTHYERLHASVSLDVLHGAADRFLFDVPAEFQITSVSSPALAQWVVRQAEGQHVLEVRLREAARQRVDLNIAATRAPVAIGEWSMPRLTARDVVGQVAVVGLLAESRLQPRDFRPAGLLRIDTDVLRRALPPSLLEAEPGAPELRPLVAYYAPADSFRLAATLQEPEDRLQVTPHLMLILNEQQQALRGGLTLTARGRKQAQFAFRLPSSWTLRRLYTSAERPLTFQRYDVDDGQRFVVRLPAGIEPGQSRTVFFEATRSDAQWLGEWTSLEVTFPSVVVEQARADSGAIAVQADGDLAVRPAAGMAGLRPLDSSQRNRFGLDASRADLVYEVVADSFAARFDVARIRPRLASRNYTFLQIQPGRLLAHYELFYSLERARARQLRFALPETTPATVAIRGRDGTALKETSARTADGRRIWTVLLAEAQLGSVHLSVDFEQRLDDLERATIALPLIETLDVRYQTHMLAVEGDPALDIEMTTSMRPVDIGELAEADYLPGRRLLGAYASTAQRGEAQVEFVRRDLRPLPTAIVQRAELVTLMSASGLSQSSARYRLRTKVPLLAVRLPRGAEFWSAVLNDKPLRPQRRGDQLLISLPGGDADRMQDLQLVYQTSVPPLGWIGQVATGAPQLRLAADDTDPGRPVPQVDLVWHVHFPSGYQLSRAAGTVYPEDATPQRLPLRRLARLTAGIGGGVQAPMVLAARESPRKAAQRALASPSFYERSGGVAQPPRPAARLRYGSEEAVGAAPEAELADGAAAAPVPPPPAGPPAADRRMDPFGTADGDSGVVAGEKAEQPSQPMRAPVTRGRDRAGSRGNMMGSGGAGGNMGDRGGMMEGMGMGAGMGAAQGDEPLPKRSAAAGATPAGQRDASARLRQTWALEGLRGLKIEFKDTGKRVTFRSLGHEPTLQATVFHRPRMEWLGWAAALLVVAAGLRLRRATVVARIRWLAAIVLLVCLLASLGGPVSEFFGVLEKVLLAAIVLVPVWILTAFGGRVGRWLGRIVRRQRPVSASAALLAALLLAAAADPAAAQDAAALLEQLDGLDTPVAIPDDAVVIPYDPTDPTRRERADEVLVPYGRYTRLWNQAHPDEKTGLPPHVPPFAIASGTYRTTLADSEHLELTGVLDIVLFDEGPVAVPLPLDGSVITDARLDGQPATLKATLLPPAVTASQVAQQQQQQQRAPPRPAAAVLVSGKGAHRLELTVRVAVTRQGGWRRVTAAVPFAEATAVAVAVPRAGTLVTRWLGGSAYNRVTQQDGQTLDVTLESGGRFRIAWRPRVMSGAVDQALTAECVALVDLSEDGVHAAWQIRFEFGQTERDTLQIAIPQDYLVEKVDGKNVRGWQRVPANAEDAARQGLLTIELLKAVKEAEQLTVQLARRTTLAATEATTVDVPLVTVPDAALQRGVVRVRRSVILDVRTERTAGVSREDNRTTDNELKDLLARTTSPIAMRDFQTYRFRSTPFQVSMIVSAVEQQRTAELRTLVRVGETEGALECEIRVTSSGRPWYELQIAVPDGLDLETVAAAGLTDWAVVKAGDRRVLKLFFSSGQSGLTTIAVAGPLPDHEADATIALPRLEVLDVGRQQGVLVVQADAALDVRTDGLTGIQPILLERARGWLNQAQRAAARFALAYGNVPYGGQVVTTPRQPRITCDTITNVRLTYREIQETILLDFQIAQAGVRQLVFQIPSWLRDAAITAPLIRQKMVEPVDGTDRVRVTLMLQDAVVGQYRVVVENDRAIRQEEEQAPLPLVETGATNYRYVTLENAGRDEVVTEEVVGMQPVQRQSRAWQRLSARLTGADFTSAYVTTAADADVRFEYATRRREVVQTAGANIGLARTELVMDPSGAYRASTLLKMDNRTEAYLEIELPEGAELWTAHVADRPVKPARARQSRSDRLLRIPLVKTAEGDLDYPVALKYGGRVDPLRTLQTVQFPIVRTVNIEVELSQVKLYAPERYRWVQFEGNAAQVDGEEDFLAGYVAYRTRQVESLTRVLRGANVFSASRALKNVQNLQAEFRLLQKQGRRSRGRSELRQNMDLNQQALEAAQQEITQLEGETAEPAGNRERLNTFYEQQFNELSRNRVLRMGSNFSVPQLVPKKDEAKKPDGRFDTTWFSRPQPAAPQTAPDDAELKKGGKGRAPVPSRLGDFVLPDPDGGQRQTEEEPAAQEAAQRVFQRQRQLQQRQVARVGGPQDEAVQLGTGRRLKEVYSDKLNQQADSQVQLGESLGVVTDPQGQTAAAGPLRAGAGLPADVTGVRPAEQGLASLDFRLPERGAVFYFTVPRGDVELHGRPVSNGFMDRIQSLVCLVVAALLFWCVLVIVRRFPRSARALTILAVGTTLVGLVMVVSLVLPLFGLVLLAAAALLTAEAIHLRQGSARQGSPRLRSGQGPPSIP